VPGDEAKLLDRLYPEDAAAPEDPADVIRRTHRTGAIAAPGLARPTEGQGC
jgi:hypothetical protein